MYLSGCSFLRYGIEEADLILARCENNSALSCSWSSGSHLRLSEGKHKKYNIKTLWSYTSAGVQAYIQLMFCFNSVLHNIKKMLNFHQTYLDQAVHCCNLLALAITGELHVADGGIWSIKLLMYSNWSLKKISD